MGDEGACLGVGALQVHADGPTTFGVQSRYRAKAREAFVRWDCGERVTRAALWKAAPVVGSFAMEHRIWIDWFRVGRKSIGETQPRTCVG